ncbi:hypothetical protein [Nocardioides campestrisoli]|uniref:hypothetical protein n=1 Tax=Nocardioides campestrisoli TaxID=2736757 RepID=UPI0015E7CB4B|nr:hypothetical protein [Nocardioides campestrisoli]
MVPWRVGAATAALLLLGAVMGWAAVTVATRPSPSSGAAVPAPAADPRFPVPVAEDLTEDLPQPALATGLALTPTSFGDGEARLSFPVPAGWKRLTNAPNEYRWKVPGQPLDTYVLRVSHVGSQKRTVAEHRAARIEAVRAREHSVRILETAGDGLEYTYVDDHGRLRHLHARWLDLTGNPHAEAEINLSGRSRDAAGARELLDRVAAEMRQG